jgi:hypothetical protein
MPATTTTSVLSGADAKTLCLRSMQIMVDGSLADFEAVVHPDAVNREAKDEPPASRGRGPAAFYATALWLRETFADLAFEVHESAPHSSSAGRRPVLATWCAWPLRPARPAARPRDGAGLSSGPGTAPRRRDRSRAR